MCRWFWFWIRRDGAFMIFVRTVDTLPYAITPARITYTGAVFAFERVFRTSGTCKTVNFIVIFWLLNAFFYFFNKKCNLRDVFTQYQRFVSSIATISSSITRRRVVDALAGFTTVLVRS